MSTAFIDEKQGYNGGDFEASSMQEQNREKTYKEGGFRKAIIGQRSNNKTNQYY